MGLNSENGNFVCITNFRDIEYRRPSSPTSRGILLNQFLDNSFQHQPPTDQCQLQSLDADFEGYNILKGNLFQPKVEMGFFTNRLHPFLNECPYRLKSEVKTNEMLYQRMPNGVHAYSNSVLNDTTWPKVQKLRSDLAQWIDKLPQKSFEDAQEEYQYVKLLAPQLAQLLTDPSAFPKETLPDPAFSPFSPEEECAVQRIFLDHDSGVPKPPLVNYGTRAQTVILRSTRCVYYFYRSTDQYPLLPEFFHYSKII